MKKLVGFIVLLNMALATTNINNLNVKVQKKHSAIYHKKKNKAKASDEIETLYNKIKLRYLEYLKKLEKEMQEVVKEYKLKLNELERKEEEMQKQVEMLQNQLQAMKANCEVQIKEVEKYYQEKINSLKNSMKILLVNKDKNKNKVSLESKIKLPSKVSILENLKSFDGYVCNKKECMVIVNGEVYHVGDILAGAPITKITKDYIEFGGKIRVYYADLVVR